MEMSGGWGLERRVPTSDLNFLLRLKEGVLAWDRMRLKKGHPYKCEWSQALHSIHML